MATDDILFPEDKVFRINRKGQIQFGTIIENSELVSSSDETSEDEYDEDYKMKKGHIRVSWHPSGLTEVLSESKVSVEMTPRCKRTAREMYVGQHSCQMLTQVNKL